MGKWSTNEIIFFDIGFFNAYLVVINTSLCLFFCFNVVLLFFKLIHQFILHQCLIAFAWLFVQWFVPWTKFKIQQLNFLVCRLWWRISQINRISHWVKNCWILYGLSSRCYLIWKRCLSCKSLLRNSLDIELLNFLSEEFSSPIVIK